MTARSHSLLLGRGLLLGLAATAVVMGTSRAVAAPCAQDGSEDAASEQERPPVPDGPRWYTSLETIGLHEMLTISQTLIGRPIEFDPKVVQGEARFGALGGYTAEELWNVVNVELAQRGLASVHAPGTEALRVVEAARAFQMARLEAPGLEGAAAGYLRVLVVLEHARAGDLVPTLQALATKDIGKIQVVAERNAVLIGDYRPELEQMLAVLKLLDAGATPPELFEFAPKHAAPLALKGLVEQVALAHGKVTGTPLQGTLALPPGSRSVLVVAPASEMSWWRSTVEHFDRRESAERVEYRPRRFGLSETAKLIEQVVRGEGMGELPGTWRVVEDRLTGTLFVTATPSQHAEIARLLARLEDVDQGPQRPMRTFEVRNRQVKEVLELLRSLLDAGVLDQPAPATATTSSSTTRGQEVVQGPTAPIPSVRASMGTEDDAGRNVVLTADEPTGRILAIGEGRLLDQIGILIETLDVRHPQVLIEALVVSLTERETRRLGIELQRHLTSGDTAIRLASLFGLGSPDPATGALGAAGGTGFSGVVLDPGEFSAVVRALETVNEGRSLQMPRVLVNNNHAAQLGSVLEQPYISVNASNTVATTSLGGTLEAGTQIEVQPQVADGDRIVLEYSITISSFVGEPIEPTLPPPRQQNTLSSVVTIPDSYTVVVGGLELETKSEATTRVPLLGKLPLVGALFRNRTGETSKSRFFVFLRASAMRSESFADLRHVTQPAVHDAGIDAGWPRLEPRWIR